jgi:hypothetical protein
MEHPSSDTLIDERFENQIIKSVGEQLSQRA